MFHLLIYNHVVLHPEKKMSHFKKYWSKPLQADVLELLEAKVRSSHIFIIFLPSDVSHSSLRGTIVSTPSPPCILIPHPLKRNPASMVCFSTLKPILTMKVMARMPLTLVIVTGNPGVFQGYPYPYPSKPIPATRVRVSAGHG